MKNMVLAVFCLIMGFGQSAQAMTQPNDIIGIHIFNGIEAKDQHKYFKRWKELGLSVQTKAALIQKNQAIEKQEGYGIEKYKIHFLFVANDAVRRVFFLGDSGTVIMMDWPKGQYCKMLFDGDAGFSASIDENCTRLGQ
jgi:hypothetical protein